MWENLGSLTGYLAALAAGMAALTWAWRTLRRLMAVADAIKRLLDRELTPNHGSSMKDTAHDSNARIRRLEHRVKGNSVRINHLEDHLGTMAESNRHLWPAIEAVAKATPSPEGLGHDDQE